MALSVWVVEKGYPFEGSNVVGVFADRESAEAAARVIISDLEPAGEEEDPTDRTEDRTTYDPTGGWFATATRWKIETMRSRSRANAAGPKKPKKRRR